MSPGTGRTRPLLWPGRNREVGASSHLGVPGIRRGLDQKDQPLAPRRPARAALVRQIVFRHREEGGGEARRFQAQGGIAAYRRSPMWSLVLEQVRVRAGPRQLDRVT